MSSNVLPSLAGLGFDVMRTPIWETVVQQSMSGKETRMARNSSPRWQWQLTYNVLRSGAAFGELQQLAGFFNARLGQFDSFLYQDADDHFVSGQVLGVGDGVTTSFQLARAFGGFIEPMLAPNLSGGVPFQPYVAGTPMGIGSFAVATWGTASPGVITFASPPASGATVACDFGYYFPCRMASDQLELTLFLSGYYKAKKLSFISVRN